jgi:16S rRNA processing protein RimM
VSAAAAPGGKASAPRPGTTQVRVARLTKAHGLKGAIKLELYTDDPDRRFRPGATFDLQVPTSSPWHGRTLELAELRWYNGHAVAFFVGVADRTAAEGLAKAILWVDHDPAELPEESDAWYDHQLVGLRALRDGTEVGLVARVDHLPAQDLLAIATPDRGEVLVPFVRAIVPAVDIAAGTVTLTPPPGLFEELPDEPEAAPLADAPGSD